MMYPAPTTSRPPQGKKQTTTHSFAHKLNLLFPSYTLEQAYGNERSNNSHRPPVNNKPAKLTKSRSHDSQSAASYSHSSSSSRTLRGITESSPRTSSPTLPSLAKPFRPRTAPNPTPRAALPLATPAPRLPTSKPTTAHSTPSTPDMPQLRSLASFSSLHSFNSSDVSQYAQKRKRLFPFQMPRTTTTPADSSPTSTADNLDLQDPSSVLPSNIPAAAARLLGIPCSLPPPRQKRPPSSHDDPYASDESSSDTAQAAIDSPPPVSAQEDRDNSGYFRPKRQASHGNLVGTQASLLPLPATLKPAAARRPSIELELDITPKASTYNEDPALPSDAASPRGQGNRIPTAPNVYIARKPVMVMKRPSTSDLRAAPVVLTTIDAPRPEHPLEAEARKREVPPLSSEFQHNNGHNSFLSGASDSEDEDRYQRSSGYTSGYSYASSQTSYSAISPFDRDIPDMPILDGSHERYFIASTGKSSYNNRTSSSTHHKQTSGSSIASSFRTGRSNSFGNVSRPYSRGSEPPLPSEPVPLPNPNNLHLAAITEDSNSVAGDIIAPPKSPPKSKASSPSHKRDGSRNFSRPRFQEKYEGRPLPPNPATALKALSTADRKSARPLSLAINKISEAVISADGAEKVILRIFEALDSFRDVSVCARLNKGFYRVCKKHELRLLKNALRNFSPAQWELREASPKEIVAAYETVNSEYTPLRYVQFHKRDAFVLSSLKSLMLQRCQAHLRTETIEALSYRDPIMSARVDDAFWRIWTFCTIFGSDSGREHNLEAQIDWLRGGVEARRTKQPVAVTSPRSRRKKSIEQWIPSQNFGQGNFGGLSIDELDDMTEIWNALKVLLQGVSRRGRLAQARSYGIFDCHNAVPGDAQAEQVLLDEWVNWIVMQGLSTISDLATYSELASPVVFATARAMDWTEWTPPSRGTTRSSFLQLAITHAQEERNAVKAFSRFSQFEPVAERRKSRGLILAATLRDGERGFDLSDDAILEEDKGLGLWVTWMTQNEGRTPSPRLSPSPATTSSAKSATATYPGPSPAAPPPLRPPHPVRARSSTNALSLFPAVNKQPNGSTGVSMTPLPQPQPSVRPRKNSILKTGESAEQARKVALEQAMREDIKVHQQLFAPRTMPPSGPPPPLPMTR